MFISLGILVLILMISIFITPVLETERYYIDKEKGCIEDTRSGIDIGNEKFQNKINVLKQFSNQTDTGEFSKKIELMSKKKLDNLSVNEYKDISFWKVFNYRVTNSLINVGMLIIISIIISNIYVDEVVTSVKDIILSSKEKKKALKSKIFVALLVPLVIYSVYLMGIFIITCMQQGVPVNGDLESFRIVDNVVALKTNLSITKYVILNIGIELLMFEGWAMIAIFGSFISKSSISSISFFIFIISITKIMSVIHILPKKLLSVVSNVNYYDLIFGFNKIIGNYLGDIMIFKVNIDIVNIAIGLLMAILIGAMSLCFLVIKSDYISR
ncbi:putative membrane protein [Clostridioides difficile R20291]|nr:putative membrane protein [Clostridioides difficile CD196]CBE04217.1 putative membrane protein [Clostridioides difficile R20291]